MSNDLKLFIVLLLPLFSWSELYSQVDSLAEIDSIKTEDTLEQLLEQSAEEEDSPVLDVILSDEHQGVLIPGVEARSRIIQKIQRAEGYEKGLYVGSTIKSYQRIKVIGSENYSGGVLFEKDAGEARFNDFMTGNVVISNWGLLSKFVLGDYRVEAGQGVALWRGFDYSKGADVITPVKRIGRGISTYISSDENSFFRGIAAEMQFGKLVADLFYSKRNLSASLDTNETVTSFYTMGYFRTSSEQAKRNALTENLVGVRGRYHFSERNDIGCTVYRTNYSTPLELNGGKRFSGNSYSLVAMDYNFVGYSTKLFGEWAGANRVIGGVSGIVLSPSGYIDLVAVYRHYPFQFVSLHGLGFGEGMSTSNEKGLYFGLRLRPCRWVTFSSYFDQYKSFEPTSDVVFPSSGNDFLAQVEVHPAQRLELTLRYQRKLSEEHGMIAQQNGFIFIGNDSKRKRHVRFNLDYRPTKKIKLRGRFEHVMLDAKLSSWNEKGWMFYEDVVFEPSEHWWWNFRLTFFRTDSYDSRISEYENDLAGVLSIPALYGRGVRWYFLWKLELANRFEFSCKYSDYIRDDVKRLGSGLDELPANHDNRIGVQIDFGF